MRNAGKNDRAFLERLNDSAWDASLTKRVHEERRRRSSLRTRLALVLVALIFTVGINDALWDDDDDDNLYAMIDDAETGSIAGTLFE